MDSDIIDDGRVIEITAKHAILIPSLPNVKSLMAYVEAVAVIIGSRHIHSVYDDQGNIKIYLTDEKFVDILVNNGVTILGRRVNVDYVVPRADKILLSNVDPIIPDSCLLNILAYYGTPASTIIHDKIAVNSEYSHIECGSRKVYMEIYDGKKLPAKIKLTYQGTCYTIDVMVEQFEKNASGISSSFIVDDRSDSESVEANSFQSVKPNLSEPSLKHPTPKQLAYWNRRTDEVPSATFAAREIKRRAKKRWLKSKVRKVRRGTARDLITSVKAGKMKKIGNRKITSPIGKRLRKGIRRGIGTKPVLKKTPNAAAPSQEVGPDSDKSLEIMDTLSVASDSLVNGQLDQDIGTMSQYPLTTEELEKFMFKTRFNREPLQVAQEFLAEKQIPDGLSALKDQLLEYRTVCKEVSVRLRIKRLISVLESADANKKTD